MKEGLDNLEIYQEAMRLGTEVWRIVSSWERFEQRTVGEQWVRSADSIAANIAEGYGRYHYKENIRFCYIARGSLTEAQTWLQKSVERDLISPDHAKDLENRLVVLLKRLNSYVGSLSRAASAKSVPGS